MKFKRTLAAAMCLCMAAPMLALQAPATVSADVTLMGDANNDGEFTIADAVMTRNWLIGSGELINWENVDFCKDNIIDSFDFIIMCRELVKQGIELPTEFFAKNLSDGIKSAEVVGAEADSKFIYGQTEFALELMKREIKEDTNTLISPYSIMQALAMTANGADGETKAEMEKVLGGMSIDQLNEYLYTQKVSQSDGENCKLSTANSIWAKDLGGFFTVNSNFLQKNANYYDADFFAAPFDDTTVKDINNWVSDKTDKKIKELLKAIDPNTMMYLINAVAFDAKWNEPYMAEDVVDSYFTDYKDQVQTVDMMYSTEHTYLSGENAEGFMKYYSGNRYAFAAILPDESIALSDYVNSLTSEELNRILSEPQSADIKAGLPKFKYDFDTELSVTLEDMGMSDAFTDGADFSKMSDRGLYINSVIHKTHIEVAEDGTRAAAVTGIGACTCFNYIPESSEKKIILDRPFIYAIVDTETNLPVFLGTVGSIE